MEVVKAGRVQPSAVLREGLRKYRGKTSLQDVALVEHGPLHSKIFAQRR
jgi:hypothetical protein